MTNRGGFSPAALQPKTSTPEGLVRQKDRRDGSAELRGELRRREAGSAMMHDVAIVAMHGVIPFDLSIPCEVFGRVRLPGGGSGYGVRVCGEAPEVRAGSFNIRAPWTLDHLVGAGTVILPGLDDPHPAGSGSHHRGRADRGSKRSPNRVHLLRGVRPRCHRPARRPAGDDALARRSRPGGALPRRDCRSRRAVHRQRPAHHVGRSLGRPWTCACISCGATMDKPWPPTLRAWRSLPSIARGARRSSSATKLQAPRRASRHFSSGCRRTQGVP